MKKVSLFISYSFLILTFAIYVISSSYNYELELNKTKLEEDIEILKEQNDDITLEINMKNSRDSVVKDYPELKFNNNINHLEEESSENE